MKKTIAVLCAALLVFALAGCGGGGSPQKTTAAFFDAAQTLDIEKMNACLAADRQLVWEPEHSDDENSQLLVRLLRELASKLSYTLNGCTQNGDAATADVTVRYVDATMMVKDALTDVMADLLATLFGAQNDTAPETLLLQTLLEKAENGAPAARTAQLTLQLRNGEDGWRITAEPDALQEILFDNTIDAFADALQTLTGKTE